MERCLSVTLQPNEEAGRAAMLACPAVGEAASLRARLVCVVTRRGGRLAGLSQRRGASWITACAGMTRWAIRLLSQE